MGAGADAEVIAEFPVIQVVARIACPPARRPTFHNGRSRPPAVASSIMSCMSALASSSGTAADTWRNTCSVPASGGTATDAAARSRSPWRCRRALLRQRLPRQRIHQVEVEIVEAGLGDFDGARRLVAVMDAAQRLQMARVEALDADRQAVDAAVAVRPELVGLEGAGIGFQRDFRATVQRQQGADIRQQAVDAGRRQQAGRAAADEDACRCAGPRSAARRLRGRRAARRGNPAREQASPLHFVRIEVAVRALPHAPGEMHVQRQRRQACRFRMPGCR